jgi:hypothetical protein
MPVLTNDTVQPLSLFEQLDAMMLGWLERNADRGGPVRPGVYARAVLTIADNAMRQVERFCAEWDMTVERPARGTIAVIEGPELAVRGFTEITAMYRR